MSLLYFYGNLPHMISYGRCWKRLRVAPEFRCGELKFRNLRYKNYSFIMVTGNTWHGCSINCLPSLTRLVIQGRYWALVGFAPGAPYDKKNKFSLIQIPLSCANEQRNFWSKNCVAHLRNLVPGDFQAAKFYDFGLFFDWLALIDIYVQKVVVFCSRTNFSIDTVNE